MMELEKYKVCPECGKHNAPNLLECRFCEADLTGCKIVDKTTETAEPAKQEQAVSTEEKTALVRICDCGAENAPQARKCKACGEDISDVIPARVPVAEKRPFIYELRSVDGSFSVSLDQVVTVIGREAQLKEYLSSKVYVSRQHAKLTVVAEKVFIENLSQTNKTFLNNEEISSETPTAVNNGDEIGLGGKVINGTRQENAAYFVFQVKA